MAQHRLQRLTSPSRTLSLILHILGVLSFCYNFHFLTVWDTPFAVAYGWHFQFLTILGLSVSLIAFAIGILSDLTLSSTLFDIKNAICIVATPVEVLISLLYWGLRAIDPSLLMPDEASIALLPDMGFHLAPAIFLTIDLVLFSPPWTIPTYAVFSISTVIAFSYWYWVELCFSHNGWYAPASFVSRSFNLKRRSPAGIKSEFANTCIIGTHIPYLPSCQRSSASCCSCSVPSSLLHHRCSSNGCTPVSMA